MEAQLKQVFFDTIKRFAAYENLKVHYPNKNFKTIGLDRYLKLAVLPVDPKILTLRGGSEYMWLLQVSIYMVDNDGTIPSDRIIGSLRNLFPVTTKLTGGEYEFQIIGPANVAPLIEMVGWSFIPVQFPVNIIS